MEAKKNLDYPRSRWNDDFGITTSAKHGELFPILAKEVIAGDTIACDLGSLCMMNTPIKPFDGEIECEVNAFFVPGRLLWSHWEEFYGANKSSSGAQTTTYTIPQVSIYQNGVTWNSVSAYLRKPIVSNDADKKTAGRGMVSVLKERAYWFIWSEFYRATMLQQPFIMTTNDTGVIGYVNGVVKGLHSGCATVCRSRDIFTGALTDPQYGGNSVTIPLGISAPLRFGVRNPGEEDDLVTTGTSLTNLYLSRDHGTPNDLTLNGETVNGVEKQILTGYADLAAATAANINTLRLSFALQHTAELQNFGGNLYWGQLLALYGVTPPDASLQRPQRLGTRNFTLNVNTVVATANTQIDGAVSPAGTVAATSITGDSGRLFIKGFSEPGYLMVLCHTRLKQQTYSQGFLKEDIKKYREEFWTPSMAGQGDDKVLNCEIFLSGSDDDNEAFGYQEYGYEYRHTASGATGVCNVNAPVGVAVNVWSTGNKFASLPTLTDDFILEDRSLISSKLVSGTSSNYDYIFKFAFHLDLVREMPVHNVPATLSHFGK